MIESLSQQCASGCGKVRHLSGDKAETVIKYNIKWWCMECSDHKWDSALLEPMFNALTRQPHLRAKLREILEMK